MSQKYLISVDQGPKISVLISDITTLKRIYQFYLPQQKSRGYKPSHSVRLAYSEKFQRIIIVENEYIGGYRISGWDFQAEKTVKLFFVADIETSYLCSSLQLIETRDNLMVITVEPNMIKYWQIEQKQAILTNRIHIKEEVGQVISEKNYNLILTLTKTGKIIILNTQGDYLDTIRGEKPFSYIASFSNYCFFGTIFGTVQIYDMKTMQKINEIPYMQEIKDSFCIEKMNDIIDEENYGYSTTEYFSNSQNTRFSNSSSNVIEPLTKKQSQTYLRNLQQGPAVVALSIFNEGNMINISHSDGMSLIYDIASNKISSSQFGHYEKINQIEWDSERQSRFFSIGNDGYFMIWNLYHDRWLSKFYDAHQTLDKDLNNCVQSKKNAFIQITGHVDTAQSLTNQKDGVKQRIKLTCMAINYAYKEIYLGDNKGCITILDLETASFIKKYKVCNFKIKKMKLCPLNSYLAIVLSTGMSIMLSILKQFQLCLKIEDHFHASSSLVSKKNLYKDIYCILDSYIINEEQTRANQIQRISNDIEIDQNFNNSPFKNGRSNSQINEQDKKKIMMQGSLNKFNAGSYYNQLNEQAGSVKNIARKQEKGIGKKEDPNSFLVISSNASNQMRLHNIQINVLDDSVTGLALMIYQTEGRITGCDIHPSRDYILILDDIGLCYLYKIRSGELRGRVEVPQFSQNVSIDPSGLYFAINSYQQFPEDYVSNGDSDEEDDANNPLEIVGKNDEQKAESRTHSKSDIVKEEKERKKYSRTHSRNEVPFQNALQMRDSGKIRDPYILKQEIARDIYLYDKNIQSNLNVNNSQPQQNNSIKPVKYLEQVDSFYSSNKINIKPKMVLLYELGTGKQVGFIQHLFSSSYLKFSSNSEYLTVCSTKGSISIWSLDQEIFENVSSVYKYMETEPTFWSNYPIYIKKNLIDVKQIKQNIKNIVNLDNMQNKREKEAIQNSRNTKSLQNQQGQQNYLRRNLSHGISNQQPLQQANKQKQQLDNEVMNDAQLQNFMNQHDKSLNQFSPIHKTMKDSAQWNAQVRNTNFDKAYQRLVPQKIQAQENRQFPQNVQTAKSQFFTNNQFVQPKINDNYLPKHQIGDQPIRILPDIQTAPNFRNQNQQTSKSYMKPNLQRQIFENPPDIDDDVKPIQQSFNYNKNYSSTKNLASNISQKFMNFQSIENTSDRFSQQRPGSQMTNPMSDIDKFERKLVKTLPYQ